MGVPARSLLTRRRGLCLVTRGGCRRHMPFTSRELRFLGGVLGIYVCYITYGIAQEGLYSTGYGPDMRTFNFVSTLLAVQCLFNSGVAFAGMRILERGYSVSLGGDVRWRQWAIVAFSYVAAMYASNLALVHIDYPTQVLIKSCKPIPVMLFGLFFSQVYALHQWVSVLVVTAGIAMFMSSGGTACVGEHCGLSSASGYVLIAVSLFFDGITGPMQNRLVGQAHPHFLRMMFKVNICAASYVLLGSFIQGELFNAVAFVWEFPAVLPSIFAVTACSALGQLYIYYVLRGWGALPLTVATTTRKFFTILASTLMFGHELTFQRWCGVFVVFGGLALQKVAKPKGVSRGVPSRKREA